MQVRVLKGKCEAPEELRTVVGLMMEIYSMSYQNMICNLHYGDRCSD